MEEIHPATSPFLLHIADFFRARALMRKDMHPWRPSLLVLWGYCAQRAPAQHYQHTFCIGLVLLSSTVSFHFPLQLVARVPIWCS